MLRQHYNPDKKDAKTELRCLAFLPKLSCHACYAHAHPWRKLGKITVFAPVELQLEPVGLDGNDWNGQSHRPCYDNDRVAKRAIRLHYADRLRRASLLVPG